MILLVASLFSMSSWALDCSTIKPFKIFKKGQSFKIEATQLVWKKKDLLLSEESQEICQVEGKIQAYDIRNREEEALACLKPDKSAVYSCDTTLNGKSAKIYFLPTIWVRTWNSKKAREYRFHALIKNESNTDDYLDLFARSLSFNIKASDIVTEGAIKSGPVGGQEGFFVRTYFQK